MHSKQMLEALWMWRIQGMTNVWNQCHSRPILANILICYSTITQK